MQLTSTHFPEGGLMPAACTCDGADQHPALEIKDLRTGVGTLAMMVDDPDSPRGFFIHWLIWNIPADCSIIPAGQVPTGAVQGTNDFGQIGWGGPCPKVGEHRYVFTLYALDGALSLPLGSGREEFLAALEGHILETTRLTGRYARSATGS